MAIATVIMSAYTVFLQVSMLPSYYLMNILLDTFVISLCLPAINSFLLLSTDCTPHGAFRGS